MYRSVFQSFLASIPPQSLSDDDPDHSVIFTFVTHSGKVPSLIFQSLLGERESQLSRIESNGKQILKDCRLLSFHFSCCHRVFFLAMHITLLGCPLSETCPQKDIRISKNTSQVAYWAPSLSSCMYLISVCIFIESF